MLCLILKNVKQTNKQATKEIVSCEYDEEKGGKMKVMFGFFENLREKAKEGKYKGKV